MEARTSVSMENGSAATTNGPDMFAIRKSVEMYDALMLPLEPLLGAILEAFQPSFLDESDLFKGQLTAEEEWKHRGQFIDVGCGTGSFTLNYLRPQMPTWCKRIVAVDKSHATLQFASERYSDPLIDYRHLDLLDDDSVAEFVQEQGCFQRVYSVMVLHWIADQRHALKNIATLMAPGGECFLVFSRILNAHRVFIEVKSSPQWSKYAHLLEDVMPEITFMENRASVRTYAAKLVHDAGLTALACEVFRVAAHGGSKNDSVGDLFTLMNPIHQKLNNDEKEELRKFTHRALEDVRKKTAGSASTTRDMVVIHACKPQNKHIFQTPNGILEE